MPAAAGHVVYLGTSSKILSRGLRVSWAVLPARFRAAMTRYLDASGEEVSAMSAAFLASFIASGALTRHHSRAMRTYRARQARFVAACREHIPAARALGIEAGLHLTLVFGRPLDDVAVVARLAEGGLACLPLSAFCAGTASAAGAAESRGVPRSGLICGYSRLPETAAGPAAALIGRVTAELAAP
jgi:GntR family transcriptional regulator/MocR family aminotransferase